MQIILLPDRTRVHAQTHIKQFRHPMSNSGASKQPLLVEVRSGDSLWCTQLQRANSRANDLERFWAVVLAA